MISTAPAPATSSPTSLAHRPSQPASPASTMPCTLSTDVPTATSRPAHSSPSPGKFRARHPKGLILNPLASSPSRYPSNISPSSPTFSAHSPVFPPNSWESPRPAPSAPSPLSPSFENETVASSLAYEEERMSSFELDSDFRGREADRKGASSTFTNLRRRSKSAARSPSSSTPQTEAVSTLKESRSSTNRSAISSTTSSAPTARRRGASFSRIFSALGGKKDKDRHLPPPLPNSPNAYPSVVSSPIQAPVPSLRGSSDRPRSSRSKRDFSPATSTQTASDTGKPSDLFKRVKRAASAPDLKQLAASFGSSSSPTSNNNNPNKKDRVFVVDKSAPPVPLSLPPLSPTLFASVSPTASSHTDAQGAILQHGQGGNIDGLKSDALTQEGKKRLEAQKEIQLLRNRVSSSENAQWEGSNNVGLGLGIADYDSNDPGVAASSSSVADTSLEQTSFQQHSPPHLPVSFNSPRKISTEENEVSRYSHSSFPDLHKLSMSSESGYSNPDETSSMPFYYDEAPTVAPLRLAKPSTVNNADVSPSLPQAGDASHLSPTTPKGLLVQSKSQNESLNRHESSKYAGDNRSNRTSEVLQWDGRLSQTPSAYNSPLFSPNAFEEVDQTSFLKASDVPAPSTPRRSASVSSQDKVFPASSKVYTSNGEQENAVANAFYPNQEDSDDGLSIGAETDEDGSYAGRDDVDSSAPNTRFNAWTAEYEISSSANDPSAESSEGPTKATSPSIHSEVSDSESSGSELTTGSETDSHGEKSSVKDRRRGTPLIADEMHPVDDDEEVLSKATEDAKTYLEDEEDLPLGAQPGALTAQKSFRESEVVRKAKQDIRKSAETSPNDDRIPDTHEVASAALEHNSLTTSQPVVPPKSPLSAAAEARNPFGFAPGELNNLPTRSRGNSGRTKVNSANDKQGKVATPFPSVGHSLLPQTDEVVLERSRRRAQSVTRPRSNSKNCKETKGSGKRNSFNPPIAPFVHNSILTCSEDEAGSDGFAASNEASLTSFKDYSSKTNVMLPHAPTSAEGPSEQQTTKRSRSQSFTNGMRRALGSGKDEKQEGNKVPGVPVPPIDTRLTSSTPSSHQMSENVTTATPNLADLISKELTVYIGDGSHKVQMEIEPTDTVKNVIERVRATGQLRRRDTGNDDREGGWALHECWSNFGLERPLRNLERISDIIKSWANGTEDIPGTLLLKKTQIAPLLSSKRKLSSSAASYSAVAYYETKKGKWSKRYISIKNNNMYHAKEANGKDETFICTLSSFDAFFVLPGKGTSKLKPPKSYAFTVKSLDPVTFFENSGDYMHNFSVKTFAERNKWFQAILDARWLYLQQVQQVNSPMTAVPQGGATVGRSPHSGLTASPRDKHFPSDMFSRGDLLRETSSGGSANSRFNAGSLLSRVENDEVQPVSGNRGGHFPDTRTWNRMTTEERKTFVSASEKYARADGRALLQFSSSNGVEKRPFTSGDAPGDHNSSVNRPPTLLSKMVQQEQSQNNTSKGIGLRSRSKSFTRGR